MCHFCIQRKRAVYNRTRDHAGDIIKHNGLENIHLVPLTYFERKCEVTGEENTAGEIKHYRFGVWGLGFGVVVGLWVN